jgi:hypothetical protein
MSFDIFEHFCIGCTSYNIADDTEGSNYVSFRLNLSLLAITEWITMTTNSEFPSYIYFKKSIKYVRLHISVIYSYIENSSTDILVSN